MFCHLINRPHDWCQLYAVWPGQRYVVMECRRCMWLGTRALP